ncbi:hypothetical protein E2C01_039405 [Portunus trituberculatus]|uniref:Uncharacterized protein n=1 Tax=Portunus trituberculatus TaxID=210409 RepID=A0A5B7FKN8_PORTR|nr:hypothetical protein [Portunus trituberculatus]
MTRAPRECSTGVRTGRDSCSARGRLSLSSDERLNPSLRYGEVHNIYRKEKAMKRVGHPLFSRCDAVE